MTTKLEQALAVLEHLCDIFPGLLDGETPVDGADLTNTLTVALVKSKTLHKYLKLECPDCGKHGVNGFTCNCGA